MNKAHRHVGCVQALDRTLFRGDAGHAHQLKCTSAVSLAYFHFLFILPQVLTFFWDLKAHMTKIGGRHCLGFKDKLVTLVCQSLFFFLLTTRIDIVDLMVIQPQDFY